LKLLGAPEPIPNRATHNSDLRDPLHFWVRLPDKETRTQYFPSLLPCAIGREQGREHRRGERLAYGSPAAVVRWWGGTRAARRTRRRSRLGVRWPVASWPRRRAAPVVGAPAAACRRRLATKESGASGSACGGEGDAMLVLGKGGGTARFGSSSWSSNWPWRLGVRARLRMRREANRDKGECLERGEASRGLSAPATEA
jgi:hypothetical protein